jgi:hypothetical protein
MNKRKICKSKNEDIDITVCKNVILDFDDEPEIEQFQRRVINKKGGNGFTMYRTKFTKSQYRCIKMLAQLGAKFIMNL